MTADLHSFTPYAADPRVATASAAQPQHPMRRKLPSLPSLQAFDAVARNRSFTRAAVDLGVTQAAITQHIKHLEELFEVQLFVRGTSGVTPTDAAISYLNTIQPSLYEISLATTRLIDQGTGDVVSVACLGAFAMKCLLPLLEEFRSSRPDINFHIRTMAQFQTSESPDYDLAVWHGLGNWPGVKAERLFEEEIFPVCSPSLLESGPKLKRPSDLKHHTIVRANSEILRDDWPFWLDAAGVVDTTFAREMACSYLLISLQAAADGLGIAIGRTGVVDGDIAAGRLVEPFDLRLSAPTAYYLVTPMHKVESPKTAVFHRWLLGRLQRNT
jgi:LysR family glycine cleavage system transcriptional activator